MQALVLLAPRVAQELWRGGGGGAGGAEARKRSLGQECSDQGGWAAASSKPP